MNPSPEVSAEAKRHMSRGVAVVEGAKTSDDFNDACNEFRQVNKLAPGWQTVTRNLAIAQDKAGMYEEALATSVCTFSPSRHPPMWTGPKI